MERQQRSRGAQGARCARAVAAAADPFGSLESRCEGELGPGWYRGTVTQYKVVPPSRQAVRGAPRWCPDAGVEWDLEWAPRKSRWVQEVRHPLDLP